MSQFDDGGCEAAFNDDETIAECKETIASGDAFYQRNAVYYLTYSGSTDVTVGASEDEMVRDVYINSKPAGTPVDLHASELDGPHEGEGTYVLPTGEWGYLEG